MGKQVEATRQLQRITALPYNPHFEEEVKKLRQKYAVPEDSIEASRWFASHWLPYGKSANALSSAFKGSFATPVGDFVTHVVIPEIAARAVDTITDTKVPLEREILLILLRYRLPLTMFPAILEYVLTDRKEWLQPELQRPTMMSELDFSKGEPEFTVIVNHLTSRTTKKQWEQIWKDEVKPKLDSLRVSDEQWPLLGHKWGLAIQRLGNGYEI